VLNVLLGQRALDVAHLGLGEGGPADPGEDAPGPVRPAVLHQPAGLSGMRREPMKKRSDGTATAVNIQRQAYWPYQD